MGKHVCLIMTALLVLATFPVMADEKKEEKKNWYDLLKLCGDFRYRQEYRHITEDSGAPTESVSHRQRARIRARLKVEAEINEFWKFYLGFATGFGDEGDGADDDPSSTNQTLKDNFGTKAFNLDLAYFKYSAMKPLKDEKDKKKHVGGHGLCLMAGKMKNPMVKVQKSQLIWDGDITPEGIAARYDGYLGEKGSFNVFAVGAFLYLDEVKDSHAQARYCSIIQAGLVTRAGPGKITFGLGNIGFPNARGNEAFAGSAAGNTVDGSDNYLYGFHVTNVFAEYSLKLGKFPFSVYVDYAVNNSPDEENTGMLGGVKFGKAKKPGQWDASLMYRKVEADAVIGAFTDSDFAGQATDAVGFVVGLGYCLFDDVKLCLIYFMTERGIDADNPDEYNRLQVDFKVSF